MHILWPHQVRGIADVLSAHHRGVRRVVLQSPTGGGKSKMIEGLIEHVRREMKAVSIYSNRKLLIDQLSDGLDKAGIAHGVRAAGFQDNRHMPVQISSFQTEQARVLKRDEFKRWDVHKADWVFVDEGHLQTAPRAQQIIGMHLEYGATVVYVTATPIEMAHVADELICAGTNSELRACGALVIAKHFGPDEPDMRELKAANLAAEITEGQQRKAMGKAGSDQLARVFGRVYESFRAINKDERPSILFAPGVPESVWLAQKFETLGVKAAHIDGEDVWVDGEFHDSSRSLRDEILTDSRLGRIKVLCNRFVLREGIDAPWLSHGIFATIFGNLQTYLQSGGRLLRKHSSHDHVTIQDHGGNWWRYGSLNHDRIWNLAWTNAIHQGMRENRMRDKKEKEPVRCPGCGLILGTSVCQGCGFVVASVPKCRPVVQLDGTLKEVKGDVFKPRRVLVKKNTIQLWTQCYFRAKNSKSRMTFRSAMGLFFKENWYWPPPTLPYMPLIEIDWFAPVADIPTERLRPTGGSLA